MTLLQDEPTREASRLSKWFASRMDARWVIKQIFGKEKEMKTYKGVVVFRYYQKQTVEAYSEEDAKRIMCEEFDLSKADGECEVFDLEEVNP